MAHFITTVFTHARRFLTPCVFLWFLFAACGFPQQAEAALGFSSEPALRIIYTADTFGYLHPCATCGDNTQGGLARRAALLQKLTAGQKRPLVIAGPNEFGDDSRRFGDLPPENKLRALHDAFSLMPYTAVYLTPRTTKAFANQNILALPKGVVVDAKPVTEYYRAGSLTVACVFFPTDNREQEGTSRLTATTGQPSQEQLADVMIAGIEAAKNAALVIGVSPWGMLLESNLMGGPAFAPFHVILGAGEGIAVPGQGMSVGGIPGPLWARADRRGKAVNVLDIFTIPGKGAAWLDGIHFTSRLVFLEKNLPEDGEVVKIIAGIPDK